MQAIKNFFGFAGECVLVFFRSVYYLPTLPWQFSRLMDYCFNIGYKTMPMVSIMSFFLGAVLVLQTGYSLKDFAGANIYLGRISGLGMSRELAPLISALLLAGRVGSSVTAEIASMKVYHEIDALKTMMTNACSFEGPKARQVQVVRAMRGGSGLIRLRVSSY